MNVHELIAELTRVAGDLPDGLDSEVRIHICNGWDADGVVTKMVNVVGEYDDEEPDTQWLLVQGHPHDDDGKTRRVPVAKGVDDEFARMLVGDPLPRPGITLVVNEQGDAIQLPFGEGKRPLLPGAPDAVAAGCSCDPERNNHGRGERVPERDSVSFVYNKQCEVHREVKIDPKDVPRRDAGE